MDNVYLNGSEDVARAGRSMQSAATDMLRAASSIEDTTNRQSRFMDDWLSRLGNVDIHAEIAEEVDGEGVKEDSRPPASAPSGLACASVYPHAPGYFCILESGHGGLWHEGRAHDGIFLRPTARILWRTGGAEFCEDWAKPPSYLARPADQEDLAAVAAMKEARDMAEDSGPTVRNLQGPPTTQQKENS
jgi:hypothetical protein